jgi:hypothetical protein
VTSIHIRGNALVMIVIDDGEGGGRGRCCFNTPARCAQTQQHTARTRTTTPRFAQGKIEALHPSSTKRKHSPFISLIIERQHSNTHLPGTRATNARVQGQIAVIKQSTPSTQDITFDNLVNFAAGGGKGGCIAIDRPPFGAKVNGFVV